MRWCFKFGYTYERAKYQRKPHHKKKSKTSNKSDWREHKQFKQDKSKHGSKMDGLPKWLKRNCNKTHRQWERQEIHHGRYDSLGFCTRKDLFDPWMWY